MKKIYLLLVFCCLGFSGFSATWYSQGATAVTTLANWNSVAGGGGATPATFATAGDIWIVQSNMTIAGAAAWPLGGSLQINTGFRIRKTAAAGTNVITIGGNLTLAGTGIISYAAGPTGSITINLAGNLSMTGTSMITNPGTGTNIINFSGAGTFAAPQTVTWTSTGVSSNTSINVNTGTYVQLLSNVPLPTGSPTGMTVNGSLICGTFVMSSGSTDPFTVTAGANFYTANAAGMNGSITFMSATTISGAANYFYNGAAAQTTGALLPAAMLSGGSVTINNGTAVNLSQTTNFASGANLNLENGTLINTAANLVMASGSNVNCDNGTLAVVPTTYSGVNLTYMDLGVNAAALTTGNEWPAAFTGNVVVNKATSTGTITINGNKVNTGSITLATGTLDVSVANYSISLTGNWINNELSSAFPFNAEAGTVTMNGTTPQTIGGSNSSFFNNFTVNNTTGVSLGGVPEYVNGTFTFVNGRVTLGSTALFFGPLTPPVAGTLSSANMIVCSPLSFVGKGMGSNGSFTFPIGDAAGNYTPITINMTGSAFISSSGMSIQMNNIKDPNNADITNYINRYWNISTSSITTPVYTATATYVPGDVVGTEANISAGAYTLALPWLKYGVTNTATHTLTTGSITALAGDISGISTAGPTVTASASTSICPGSSTPLSVASATGDPVLTFSWAPASGLSATTGTPVIASPTVTTTYTVTVTDGNGFTGFATTTVTVNSAPVTGASLVCIGLSTDLTDAFGGGNWVSSVPAIASVGSSTGHVTGVGAGTTTISYVAGGCTATLIMTVNTPPNAVSGAGVCTGQNTTLAESIGGGTWSTTDLTVTVGSTTGNVIGVSAGTALISYTVPSCIPVTAVVTVNPFPSAISGATAVCEGGVTPLSDITGGGSWTSSSPSNGSVDVIGDVTGILTGPITIFYSVAGCAVSQVMTVNPAPVAITGAPSVCVGSTVNLSDLTGGGAWSSNATLIATINAATGDVTGVSGGTATISYILATTGCFALYAETVDNIPAAITGTFSLCTGQTYNLSDVSGGGTWSSNFPIIASIVPATGDVTGNIAGTTDITYTTSANCYVTQNVTVNTSPVAITGPTTVCVNDSVALTDATPGGGWNSGASYIASVGPAGEVTGVLGGASTTITYTVGNGCTAIATVNVSAMPSMIMGDSTVCNGYTILLTDSIGGGTWTSSAAGSASVPLGGPGVVTGVAPGSVTITYTIAACAPVTHNVTVNPNPLPITGSTTFCDGLTSTVFDLTPGGVWTSGNPLLALAGSAGAVGTGTVTGVSLGITNISYTLPTGCFALWTVTVNPAAPPISGTDTICATGTAWLTDIVGGGNWTSSNPAVATITADSGYLTGIVPGITYIVYTLPLTGCSTSLLITSKPAVSPISGPSNVCTGSMINLTDPDPRSGGTWSSSNNYVASIDTGTLAGLFPDTVVISYTISAFEGCYATKTVTVDPLPVPVISYIYASHSVVVLGLYTSYQWYNDRTGLLPGATTANYVLPHRNDSVSVTVTDANGCTGSATWFYYDYTGVNNVNTSAARIYPNPATSTLFIESAVTVRAVVSAMDGKTVLEQADAKQIDITGLASGMYIVTLYDAEGQALLTGKLVKE